MKILYFCRKTDVFLNLGSIMSYVDDEYLMVLLA